MTTTDAIKADNYTIEPARYAKGKIIVHTPSPDGFKTRAARLAESIARGRYTHRERGYVMGPRQLARFQVLYAQGWDAGVVTRELQHP